MPMIGPRSPERANTKASLACAEGSAGTACFCHASFGTASPALRTSSALSALASWAELHRHGRAWLYGRLWQ